jgi:hypothetical protein
MAAKINHMSHGFGPMRDGHAHSDIARDGAPKRVHPINVHSAMKTRTQSGGDALSGHEASGIDSVSGATVPGNVTATPGYGNAGVQSGHPLAKAPGAKRLTPVAPSFGQRSRGPRPDDNLHALGTAMLAEAFAASDGADCAAHGRNRDGTK